MSDQIEDIVIRARVIAELENETSITPTHLSLAIMSARISPWPNLILERGGFSYEKALRRLRSDQSRNQTAGEEGRPKYRSSMRLMLIVFVMDLFAFARALVRRVFSIDPHPSRRDRPELDPESIEVMRLTQVLAAGGAASSDPGEGHVLLALVSRPGEHLRVLPNSTIIACAVRKRLGLATRRHRLILACDRPKCLTRRGHIELDRKIAANGRRSVWGGVWFTYGALGVVFAIAVFPITVLAMAFLYLFLWPAALLMSGLRTLCGMIVGCDARSFHWLKVPGGDVALTPKDRPASPRAVAIGLLAPRMLALALCLVTMTVLFWRSDRLGVVISPVIFRRPDLLTGAATEGEWLGPLSIFSGMLEQDGIAAGIGLLAGLGAGVMSIPTFREVELIRLHAGHEVGGGPRLARLITAPASLFTGAVSCVEAVLPFTGSPIYATAYIVPLFIAASLALVGLELTPY
ncbi:MAG TPA: hypothetical protein VI039_12080 [Solirubrobacterales bacterium]